MGIDVGGAVRDRVRRVGDAPVGCCEAAVAVRVVRTPHLWSSTAVFRTWGPVALILGGCESIKFSQSAP